MVWLLTVLRLFHILAGVFWAGSAISLIGFIEPAARATGSAGATFFQGLWQHTRMLFFMNMSSLLTALTGVVLYMLVSNGNPLAYIGTGIGMGFTLGSAAGLIEFFNGILVMGPTSAKISALGAQMQTAGGPPTQVQLTEMSTLQERLNRGGKHGAVLLVLAVIGMAVARYL
jgi:hypothetical protein